MPTRQGLIDFEQNLIEVLKKENVADRISNIILSTITSQLSQKFKTYDEKIIKLEEEIILLKNLNNEINETKTEDKQRIVEKKLDNVQQHIKNDNLRLIQIPEADDENVHEKVFNIFKNKMNVDINKSNIAAAYRVGKKNENKPRHVVVVFNDNSTKMRVYNKKKSLKGTKIVIKEDLTVSRVKTVREASEKYGFKNVWTVNGHIFARTDQGVEKINLN